MTCVFGGLPVVASSTVRTAVFGTISTFLAAAWTKKTCALIDIISSPLGARNKLLPARLQADLPLYGRGMMVKNSRITLSSALLEPRKGTPSPRLEEAEFRRRFLNRFQDPAFDSLRSELDKVASAAWDAYEHQRKAPAPERPAPHSRIRSTSFPSTGLQRVMRFTPRNCVTWMPGVQRASY